MRFAFITATPLDVIRGSGTFSGVATLSRALEALGCGVRFFTPRLRLPVYTLERLWFNESLRRRDFRSFDAVIGFDMDGYRIAGRGGPPHIASIKGVIADEMRFERGLTRRTLAVQAACERRHVQRADAVFTTSRYAAARIQELYGAAAPPFVVPELIDLALWRDLFARAAAAPDPARFTVLSVCRFYPRKRLGVLLEAARRLRSRIPELRVRIVGDGPEGSALRRDRTVDWLGDLPQDALAREYQQCDVFCLPSVQEGFGIVFLEAMAAGKPVVAVRAAAAPEVVSHGLLAEPDDAASLAEAIARFHASPGLRAECAAAGREAVQRFDAPLVARRFLSAVADQCRRSPC